LLAHSSYWRDTAVSTYIVSRTYGRDILPVTIEARQFLPPGRMGVYRALSLVVTLPLLVGAAAALLFGAWWLLLHPARIWQPVWGWVRHWLSLGGLAAP
jgi:hypothetical protein